MAKAAKPVPDGYHTITPQLAKAAETIERKKAFGAEELGRHLGPDGKVMHAELEDRQLARDGERCHAGLQGLAGVRRIAGVVVVVGRQL